MGSKDSFALEAFAGLKNTAPALLVSKPMLFNELIPTLSAQRHCVVQPRKIWGHVAEKFYTPSPQYKNSTANIRPTQGKNTC